MAKRTHTALDFEIDKLTNSIENTLTSESFPTEVFPVTKADLTKIKAEKTFGFDWSKESKRTNCQLYKLTTNLNPHVIHGLISIEKKADHIYMSLIESAKFNRGKSKIYLGVPGNLVAFACKLSFEFGFGGYVAFDAKTALIHHYKETLYATHFKGTKMYIDTPASARLVAQYFSNIKTI
ncbi:MAG: hypothetical protein FWD02_00265 [Bacteroidales bacterium]|nr:hypothetical protein [Bacteroidales bacterium]